MRTKLPRISVRPWTKDFLTSILGTTISIALTFGTTALVDLHNKKTAQKQTAMMVIHDINKNIEALEYNKGELEKNYESAQYFLEYMDRPGDADQDRLAKAIDESVQLLTNPDQDERPNDATEKIFTGSMDAWSNLSNMRFIENVQYFYYSRNSWLDVSNNSIYWQGPISEAEIVDQMAKQDYTKNNSRWDIWGVFLREKMKDKKVRYFLDIVPNRVRQLDELIQSWSDLNEENMFLMNITDEELDRFVTQMENKTSPLNERDLAGIWVNSQSVSNSLSSEIEFRPDHSFEMRDTTKYTSWQFRGKINVAVTIGGTWEIRKDSLIRNYDPESLKTAIDSSGISVAENMKAPVTTYLKSVSDYYEKTMPQYFEKNQRSARRGNFDLTRNKMELGLTVSDSNGQPREETAHYKRKK